MFTYGLRKRRAAARDAAAQGQTGAVRARSVGWS